MTPHAPWGQGGPGTRLVRVRLVPAVLAELEVVVAAVDPLGGGTSEKVGWAGGWVKGRGSFQSEGS